ncbi:MAG: histidine--tRNA ligase [Sedimentisphaerales bacterium]|nr:histidine--tRNA ligase [Sedimentisphaerales bacterium]
MEKIQSVKGTRDFYPEEMAARNWLFDGWRAGSLRNGFVEYDSPIFEYLQLYTAKSGDEIAGQLFSLTDRGGRELAIRPETTPSLARMVNQRINSLPRPVKWFSISRLCRAERPQKGRLREFFQWNIDIISDSAYEYADADCIYTAVDYLRSVGLTKDDIIVKISSRAMLAELLRSQGFSDDQLPTVYSLLDKQPKIPPDKFTALTEEQIPDADLREKLMRLQSVDSIGELIEFAPDSVQESIYPLETLFHILGRMGIADYCGFDINIVRGLAYYTGMVFEIFDRRSRLRAVCGGGRYDNLLAGLGGPSVPAVGFGMGDVVLEIMLREKNLLDSVKNTLDFFIVYDDHKIFEDKGLSLVNSLREKGFSTAFDYRRTSAMARQLKMASSQNARFAVILGQETIDSDEIILKNMADGSQKQIAIKNFLMQPPKVRKTPQK